MRNISVRYRLAQYKVEDCIHFSDFDKYLNNEVKPDMEITSNYMSLEESVALEKALDDYMKYDCLPIVANPIIMGMKYAGCDKQYIFIHVEYYNETRGTTMSQVWRIYKWSFSDKWIDLTRKDSEKDIPYQVFAYNAKNRKLHMKDVVIPVNYELSKRGSEYPDIADVILYNPLIHTSEIVTIGLIPRSCFTEEEILKYNIIFCVNGVQELCSMVQNDPQEGPPLLMDICQFRFR